MAMLGLLGWARLSSERRGVAVVKRGEVYRFVKDFDTRHEATAGPQQQVAYYSFESPEEISQWRLGDGEALRLESGEAALEWRVTRGPLQRSTDLGAEQAQMAVLEMRVSQGGLGRFAWTYQQGARRGEGAVAFLLRPGRWAAYQIPLVGSGGWTGRITSLRITPSDRDSGVAIRALSLVAVPIGLALQARGENLGQLSVSGQLRRVVYAPPPRTISKRVRLPDDVCRLTFGHALLHDYGEPVVGGVRFVVTVTDRRTREQEVYSRVLDPWTRPQERRWHDAKVPLARWAGEEVTISLRTEFTRAGTAPHKATFVPSVCAVWSSPEVRSRARAEGKPDIILVVIDALRADRVGALGSAAGLTPNLDRIAERGVVFRQAVTNATWTVPSMSTLFTSKYPSQHGAVTTQSRLGDEWRTLAEVLSDHGYATAAFLPGGMTGWRYGWAQGFDVAPYAYDLKQACARAAQWYRDNWDRPRFLWLHTYQVHDYFRMQQDKTKRFDPDYEGPVGAGFDFLAHMDRGRPAGLSQRDIRHLEAQYDAEVADTDAALGEFLAALRGAPAGARAAVIVTADHGEAFGEHGVMLHKYSLYEEELRVPLIIQAPAAGRGRVVEDQVALIDLMPTILGLAGIPPLRDLEGRSLVPLMRGQRLPAAQVIAESFNPDGDFRAGPERRAIRFGGLKYIWTQEMSDGPPPPREELYELRTDPGERTDLSSGRPEAIGRMRDALERFVCSHDFGLQMRLPPNDRPPENVQATVKGLGDTTIDCAYALPGREGVVRLEADRCAVALSAMRGDKGAHFIIRPAPGLLGRGLEVELGKGGAAGAKRVALGRKRVHPPQVPFVIMDGQQGVALSLLEGAPPVRGSSEVEVWVGHAPEWVWKRQTQGGLSEAAAEQLKALGYLR